MAGLILKNGYSVKDVQGNEYADAFAYITSVAKNYRQVNGEIVYGVWRNVASYVAKEAPIQQTEVDTIISIPTEEYYTSLATATTGPDDIPLHEREAAVIDAYALTLMDGEGNLIWGNWEAYSG